MTGRASSEILPREGARAAQESRVHGAPTIASGEAQPGAVALQRMSGLLHRSAQARSTAGYASLLNGARSEVPLQRKAAVKSLSVQWDAADRPGFDINTSAEFYDNGGYTAADADVYQYTTGSHKIYDTDEHGDMVVVSEGTNAGTDEDWSRATAPNCYQDTRAEVIDRAGFDNGDIPDGQLLVWDITARQRVVDRTDGETIAHIEQQAGNIDGTIPLQDEDYTTPAAKQGVMDREPVLGGGGDPWHQDDLSMDM